MLGVRGCGAKHYTDEPTTDDDGVSAGVDGASWPQGGYRKVGPMLYWQGLSGQSLLP